MAEQIYTNSLTTLQRVKDLLNVTIADHDAVLTRFVNAATDYIENTCRQNFKQNSYVEKYSIWGGNMQFMQLNNLHVTALTKLEIRGGLPSTPNWITINPDFYELVENGDSGLIRLYPGFSSFLYSGVNSLQASYTAGYLIDFTNFGNKVLHNLPADLSGLCERIVMRWWKRRESGGKQSESLNGSNINWKDLLDSEDYDILQRYTRPGRFV